MNAKTIGGELISGASARYYNLFILFTEEERQKLRQELVNNPPQFVVTYISNKEGNVYYNIRKIEEPLIMHFGYTKIQEDLF